MESTNLIYFMNIYFLNQHPNKGINLWVSKFHKQGDV